MGLFKPIWMTKNYQKLSKAEAAVEKISDQQKLYEIATSAPIISVKETAVKRITDQRLLYQLVLGNCFYEVEFEAKQQLTDPQLVKQAVLTTDDKTIYKDFINKINDPDDLKDIYQSTNDPSKKLIVVEHNRSDLDFLMSIMISSPDIKERRAAIDSIRTNYVRDNGYYYKKGVRLTKEQYRQFIDATIRDANGKYSIPFDIDYDDLRRIYREANYEELRAQAALRMVPIMSWEERLEAYKEWRMKTTLKAEWKEAWQRIEGTLTCKDVNDTEHLMAFIRDPETGDETACRCIKSIFDPSMDNEDGIDKIREEAFATYLSHCEYYAKSHDYYHDKEHFIGKLALSLPDEQLEKYGFIVSGHEFEAEDQYGRYTSHATIVEYNGKRICLH